MKLQFFDGRSKYIFLACLVLNIFAVLAWYIPAISPILLALTAIFVFWLSKNDLPTAFGVLFVELIIGGHGHLLSANIFGFNLNLRLITFAIVAITTIYQAFIKNRQTIKLNAANSSLLALAVYGIGSFILGGLNNGWSASFDDANSFLYLLLILPAITHKWINSEKRTVVIFISAALTYLVTASIAWSFAYTHFPGKLMRLPYVIFRDARISEVSLQVIKNPPIGILHKVMAIFAGTHPYWYRIFEVSQLYLILALCTLLAYGLLHGVDRSIRRTWGAAVVLLLAALFTGMSRSLLLGLGTSAIIGAALVATTNQFKFKNYFQLSTVGIVTLGLGFLVFAVTPTFSLFGRPDLSTASFYATSAETTRQLAVSSRWNLLTPLLAEINKSPIIGQGFGKTVTYQSDDPRINEETGGQPLTTYRFEWGYQDLWLKMGLIGLALYAFFIAMLLWPAVRRFKDLDWLELGAVMALIALLVTHVFTPYLNHPLGIGFLIYLAIILKPLKTDEALIPMKMTAPAKRSMVGAYSIKEGAH